MNQFTEPIANPAQGKVLRQNLRGCVYRKLTGTPSHSMSANQKASGFLVKTQNLQPETLEVPVKANQIEKYRQSLLIQNSFLVISPNKCLF